MRFGLFGGTVVPHGDPPAISARKLADYIETNVEAEGLGYYATFLTEHHFTGVGQISAPLQVLTAIAMRTTRLRLGTAVMVLAWHNPAMLAEQAATLDLISNGRLELGIGKGYRASEFSGFAMPVEEAEGRFDEAFAVLKQASASKERFSHHGTYWHFDNVLVDPNRRSCRTRLSGLRPATLALSAGLLSLAATCCWTSSSHRLRLRSASRSTARSWRLTGARSIRSWWRWRAMFTLPKERLTEKRHLPGRSQYIGAWWSYRNGSVRQIARTSCSTTPRPEARRRARSTARRKKSLRGCVNCRQPA